MASDLERIETTPLAMARTNFGAAEDRLNVEERPKRHERSSQIL